VSLVILGQTFPTERKSFANFILERVVTDFAVNFTLLPDVGFAFNPLAQAVLMRVLHTADTLTRLDQPSLGLIFQTYTALPFAISCDTLALVLSCFLGLVLVTDFRDLNQLWS